MALSCGCEMRGGMAVPQEMVKEHYKHTLEVMVFWEMMRRESPPEDEFDNQIRLSQARIEYFEALEIKFPELKEE